MTQQMASRTAVTTMTPLRRRPPRCFDSTKSIAVLVASSAASTTGTAERNPPSSTCGMPAVLTIASAVGTSSCATTSTFATKKPVMTAPARKRSSNRFLIAAQTANTPGGDEFRIRSASSCPRCTCTGTCASAIAPPASGPVPNQDAGAAGDARP